MLHAIEINVDKIIKGNEERFIPERINRSLVNKEC